jgi:hypothetical protein
VRQVAPIANRARCNDFDLACELNRCLVVAVMPRSKELPMTRLETIANRQRRSRARDFLFACFVALAAVIGASTVGAAVHAAAAQVAQR